MKHHNPTMNITKSEALEIKAFLGLVGFPVRDILCDPTPYGQRNATMVPEENIPDDGEAYSLVYLFEGSGNRDYHQVVTVRDILGDKPSLHSLRTLHGVIWPTGAQSDFDARVMRNPEIQQAVNGAILRLDGIATPVEKEIARLKADLISTRDLAAEEVQKLHSEIAELKSTQKDEPPKSQKGK